MQHSHTVSMLVIDHPGVLQRTAALFNRRGFNIDSITVGPSEEKGLSRMVIVTLGDDRIVRQVINQVEKLVDVVSIEILSEKPMVARELALIKVNASPAQRPEIITLAETFRATIADVGHDSLVVQIVGDTEKIEAMIELLVPYEILEVCRTGVTAIARGRTEKRTESEESESV